MIRFGIITLIMLVVISTGKSQSENWDVYLAQYDEGVGSTTLNMDLINRAPIRELSFLVVTGVTAQECPQDGLPSGKEFNNLYNISDDVNQLITSITKSESVGTFTCQCDRHVYFYVQDTLLIRDKLTALYNDKYKTYPYYIEISPDLEWEAYLTFLYPNEEIQEYMSNTKVLEQLESAGDKLVKPRTIDHWLYFKSKADRDAFIKYAALDKFKIESADFINDSEFPYQLHISRVNSVDIQAISMLTLALRKKAKEFNGDYDGWECVVVKD